MQNSLIMPLAADKDEYSNEIPYLFRLDSKGRMICMAAICGMDLDKFDNIYVTILKKHSIAYLLKELLLLQFKRLGIKDKAHVIELDFPTQSQPETVYQTIIKNNIIGKIFIKDADSYFEAEIPIENSVCVYPLDNLIQVNPQNKSYVNVDDMYYITNIIEKRILGREFCAGGYFFEDASLYCTIFKELRNNTPLYMSHIIYKALLCGYSFRPVKVNNYKDWGTLQDWRTYE